MYDSSGMALGLYPGQTAAKTHDSSKACPATTRALTCNSFVYTLTLSAFSLIAQDLDTRHWRLRCRRSVGVKLQLGLSLAPQRNDRDEPRFKEKWKDGRDVGGFVYIQLSVCLVCFSRSHLSSLKLPARLLIMSAATKYQKDFQQKVKSGEHQIRYAAKVDLEKDAGSEPYLHNRWHPDIPTYGTIKNNETVKIECVDWTGGQIGNNDSADDMRDVDLTRIHYLTGPFEIETAEPGDILLVDIQDVQPLERQPWGFTGIFAKENGGGFLDEVYPKPAKAIWNFEGIHCTTRHIPGVKFAGLIHPGILGCAPSAEVLNTWNTREGELIAACKNHPELGSRDVAMPPEPINVHAGGSASDEIKKKVGNEGARTVPGRPEHGGNCDIKNLSRGSKVYLPVHVKGAKFSVGDLHFSQGDGEISFCGAIEIAGVITINFKVIKNGMADLGLKSPIYIPGPVEPQFGPGRHIYFEGFSVDSNGKQHYLDATVAYRQTCLRVIEYMRRFGYDDYQTYLLLSCAPVQGHIAGIVDIPNACTTLGLPVDIFDFDIMPGAKIEKRDLGACAKASS